MFNFHKHLMQHYLFCQKLFKEVCATYYYYISISTTSIYNPQSLICGTTTSVQSFVKTNNRTEHHIDKGHNHDDVVF